MKQLTLWPPPDWSECIVTWDWLMDRAPKGTIHEMYAWCDQYPSRSRYHVHGWRATEGFVFKFEDSKDAVMFKLKWPYQ